MTPNETALALGCAAVVQDPAPAVLGTSPGRVSNPETQDANEATLRDPLGPTLRALDAELARRARNRREYLFPATGPLRRELYQKHLEFFAAGAQYKERLFMAANRVGKTLSGAYELVCHLTGQYPDWWEGHRFSGPIEAWACGTTSETTRDVVQRELLGPPDAVGTGMIPGKLVVDTKPRPHGMPGALESIWVRHVRGGYSKVGLKSYEQGRKSFEGTGRHVIWCDEEPPEACYTEMLMRTVTTKGIVYTTFTPLQGMSEVVKGFLEPETKESALYKRFIQAGWKDVPHLDEEEKTKLLATTPRYQLKARTVGEPTLGAGAIYPIAEEEILTRNAPIPESWPRCFGMDVGWNRTAAVWIARNPANGVYVLYDEYYQGHGEPVSHAMGIRARGDWIPGVIDPAAGSRSQIDGRELLAMYRKLGLNILPADDAVETGLDEVWQLLVSGMLKVQPKCENWLREFRRYHRDEKGKIVKSDDHLMDALRYAVKSGRNIMKAKPVPRPTYVPTSSGGDRSWMV